jgi:hypothetical protein
MTGWTGSTGYGRVPGATGCASAALSKMYGPDLESWVVPHWQSQWHTGVSLGHSGQCEERRPDAARLIGPAAGDPLFTKELPSATAQQEQYDRLSGYICQAHEHGQLQCGLDARHQQSHQDAHEHAP